MSTDPITDITSSLSKDGLTLTLEMIERPGDRVIAKREMSAVELTFVIEHLAMARAAMQDIVPPTLDPGKQHFPNTQLNPATFVGNEGPLSKRFLLCVRHPGYGWMAFAFNKQNGQRLTAFIQTEIVRMAVQPGIVGPSGVKL